MRVLEKCGFKREAVHKKAIIKKGLIYDEIRYAKIIDELTVKTILHLPK
jgi:RimJ/RimL family protein N-acetyltransferase